MSPPLILQISSRSYNGAFMHLTPSVLRRTMRSLHSPFCWASGAEPALLTDASCGSNPTLLVSAAANILSTRMNRRFPCGCVPTKGS